MTCTAAPLFEKDFPDTTSDAAKEGTLAHEICELKLQHYFFTTEMTTRKYKARLKKLETNELYQSEMAGHTDAYLDYIKTLALSFGSAPSVRIEDKFDLGTYAEGCFGSADCVLIHGNALHVIDFKYGKGVPVSPEENPQLMLYALGVYDKYKMLYPISNIHLHIIQPRIDNSSEWVLDIKELTEFGELVKQKSAEALDEDRRQFNPSSEACRFCRGRNQCRARADENVKLAFMTDKKPETIGLDEIGQYLSQGEDVAKWLADLKEYALGQCLAGNEVAGYKAVEGRGSRAWTDADKAFETLQSNGIEETMLYERVPLTLAKLEKEIGKKPFTEMVGDFVVKNPGKPALVKESDNRPAITNKVSAEEAFGTGGDNDESN